MKLLSLIGLLDYGEAAFDGGELRAHTWVEDQHELELGVHRHGDLAEMKGGTVHPKSYLLVTKFLSERFKVLDEVVGVESPFLHTHQFDTIVK